MNPFPLTPLEQLPLTIDHQAIEDAYLPFLLEGPDGARAWKSDYARRRRRALLRMIKRILGLKQRGKAAIQAEYQQAWGVGHGKYDVAAGPKKPAAWRWRGRKLALDGLAAARLRAPLLAAVIERLDPKKVLEVGCGNGINLFSLAGDFPAAEFTGIDSAQAGIEAAKAVQAQAAMPPALAEYIPLPNPDPMAFKRINFVAGSAAELPFADGEFDLVYTVLAVDQLDRIREAALAEIARVSRGHVLMIEPFRDANRKGVRRLSAVGGDNFRGSIEGLARFGLEPLWATDDFPQEAFLGSPLVLARKAPVKKL